MVGVRVTCAMSGASFSPALAERTTGLTLQHKSEPGEEVADRLTGTGKPAASPGHGHAELLIQEFGTLVELGAREGTVLMALARSLEAFRRAGATELKVRLEIEYAGHCQFELPAELLRRLADLGIPVLVSAFPTDETEDLLSRSLG